MSGIDVDDRISETKVEKMQLIDCFKASSTRKKFRYGTETN